MAIYLANDKYAAVLTSGYTAGQNTLYVSAVPDNVPTIIVAAKGTDNETIFAVTGSTVNSLTGVTRLKGADVDLDSQTPLTCLNNQEFLNQYSGAVSTPETLKNIIYAEDGGSTDAYAISLDPAPSAYVAGMLVAFKANTANTGAATLNINSLGAEAIKTRGRELETGEIEAGQIATVVYDGTDFQLVSRAPVIAGDWIPTGETWAYASATTITVPTNATLKYQKGDKVRLKQGGAYKYFYVVGVAATVLTVTGGDDYTVAEAAITDNYYSKSENPQGFPDWFNFSPSRELIGGTGNTVPTYTAQDVSKFRITGKSLYFKTMWNNASGGTVGAGTGILHMTLPSAIVDGVSDRTVVGFGISFENSGTIQGVAVQCSSATNKVAFKRYDNLAPITGADQSSTSRNISTEGFYEF